MLTLDSKPPVPTVSLPATHLEQAVSDGPSEAMDAPAAVRQVVNDPGEPLDPPTRALMETRLGHDFGSVRVHAGERSAQSARAVNAEAYAIGWHIVLGDHVARNSSAGRELLAHELAHVAQSEETALPEAGTLRIGHSPRQESEADLAARAVRPGVQASAPHLTAHQDRAQGTVQLRPADVIPGGGISLLLDENGRVTITASGPELPGVGSPAIGIRRNADGTYQIVAGGKGKLVAPGEIPELLRAAIAKTAKPGQGPQVAGFRVPTCDQLRTPDGTRNMTFDEYRVSQILSSNLLPMTPALYDAVVAVCPRLSVKQESAAPEPESEPGDFPQRTLPEGMEQA